MSVQKHIHKLKKHTYPTGNSVYFCTLDCGYKVEVPLAVGKQTICNICSEPFTMTEITLKLVRPHCQDCGRRQVKDSEGRRHYVRKIKNKILTDIAADKTSNLRDRLLSATTVSDPIRAQELDLQNLQLDESTAIIDDEI